MKNRVNNNIFNLSLTHIPRYDTIFIRRFQDKTIEVKGCSHKIEMRQQKRKTQQPDILEQIAENNISPIYLLYGEEEFLIEETLTRMMKLLVSGETRDFNLEIYNGLDVSVEEIITSAETYPVMSDRRVIVVKEPTFFKGNKGLSGRDILGNAIEAYESDNLTKMMTLLGKALELPADIVAEYDDEVKNALREFIEANKEDLSSEEMEFLSNLKDIVAKADVRPTSAGADEITRFIDWLSRSLPDSSVLILTLLGTVDKRSKLFKAIDKVGEAIDLTPQKAGYGRSLEEDQTYQMVKRKLQESGKGITTGAYISLKDKAGDDMRLIFDELEKLITFVGDKQQIAEEDIDSLVSRSSFDNIFALTNAIAKRDLRQSFKSLSSNLRNGESPGYIHSMITRQIRLLLQAKLLLRQGWGNYLGNSDYTKFAEQYRKMPAEIVAQLPDKTNLLKQRHPYSAFITFRNVGNYTEEELVNAMARLLEADIQLKSSQSSPEVILEQLVVDLCGKNKRPVA